MPPDLPKFSIIIATRSRPSQLDRCLRALAGLDYTRGRLEVIIVDDGSVQPLGAVVGPWRDRLEITLLGRPHAGPAAARNRGVDQARGEYLAFTDDDCCPAPDWLSRLAARFARTPDHAIGGRTMNALPANAYSTASQMLISYLYSYYNANPERAVFLTTNNLALPTAQLRAAGGLNPTYTRAAAEDCDLCDRWLQRGWGLTYAPEAVVYHAHALTLGTFVRQHLHYGRGAFQFRLARAARHCGPVRIEPLRFYAQLLSYPFTQPAGHPAPLLAALLALSQVANAAGFIAEWVRSSHTPESQVGGNQ
jgi:cellulose synthase/poly-beta-1,6-N-acetylglucosamine synthase-like glycosyltransferase